MQVTNPTELIPYTDKELQGFCAIVGGSKIFKVRCAEEVMAKAVWSHAMGVHPIIGLQMIDIIQGNPAPSGALIASRLDASDNYAKYIVIQSSFKCMIAFFTGAGMQKSSPYANTAVVPELEFYDWFEAQSNKTPDDALSAKWRLEEGNLTLREMAHLKHYLSQNLKPGCSLAGVKEWTLQNAKDAGLTGKGSWKTYADSMLLWRCMSNGQKAYASDLWQGGKVYTPEELGAEYQEPEKVKVEVVQEEDCTDTDYIVADFNKDSPTATMDELYADCIDPEPQEQVVF